jgi:succinate dehydrogenase/fumarate reductase flavoprotein subunit
MIDVLIIGSGIAGLTAAINASLNNTNVLVLSKTFPTHSQSVQAQGGINAVLYEENDNINNHIEDTYKASCNIANKKYIRQMCENAKDAILWLDKIGVPFTRTSNNRIAQRKFGGASKIRTCYSSDYTGLKILHTLYDKAINLNIKIESEYLLLNLIIEEQQCIGVTVLDINRGELKEYYSKTIILATGGYAGIYSKHSTNSYSNTGDGIAVAFNAGVELSNMEFVQFHPTTLENSHILISESARGEGGFLLDKDKNRFIDELKPRDEVARAIYERILNNEKVYLDLRHFGLDKINELIPQEKNLALQYSNIEIENELLPITPAAHYSMGGIKTDINGKTNIKNLYACGECAQSFIHGANRLGGNSLLEIVTYGKIVGLRASSDSKNISYPENRSNQLSLDKKFINKLFSNQNKINFYSKKEEISALVFEKLGLFRNESDMVILLEKLKEIESNIPNMGIGDKSKIYNKNLVEFIEFINIVKVSILTALCAKDRLESRGSHYRLDYPTQKKFYEKTSLIRKVGDKIKIEFEEII